MMGFFEHQYLSYKKSHIKNLLALANVDGHMHEKEVELLFKIGKGYGLKRRQIQELIDSDEKFDLVVPNNHNDKMNLLYDLILMMYADEIVDADEVKFCEEAAEQFGFKIEVVDWLTNLFAVGTPPSPDEWEALKHQAERDFKAN